MAESFDAYHKWLGIPPAEQPPHHYRLLGLSLYESDPDVIEIAADQRMALLRSFHAGPHSDLTQKLLNEVAAARLTLLRPDRRTSYNDILRRRSRESAAARGTCQTGAGPGADQPNDKLTHYYEKLRQHVEHETPRPDTAALLDTLVPVEPLPGGPIVPVKPVRPINPAPLAAPVAAPPKVAATVTAAAAPVAAPPKVAATVTAAAVPSVVRDRDLGPAPKPAAKPTSRIDSNRTIALPPRSAAWDQAIEEACGAETALSRPRRRWHVSGRFIQLVIGACLVAGLFYGGVKGFILWQQAEARRLALAKHDVRPPMSPRDIEPDVPVVPAVAAVETQPPHADTVVSQPVPSEPNDPSLNDARSVAGGFGLPTAPAPHSAPATGPSPSGDTQPPTIVRTPIPSGEVRRRSTEAVADEIKVDSRRAGTATGQSELAHKLADKANQTADDPAKRFVLANRALELAIKLCDVRLASDLVGGVTTFYDLDPWALRQDSPKASPVCTQSRDSRGHRRSGVEPRRAGGGRRSLRQRLGVGDDEHEPGDGPAEYFPSRSGPRVGRPRQADPTMAHAGRGREIPARGGPVEGRREL